MDVQGQQQALRGPLPGPLVAQRLRLARVLRPEPAPPKPLPHPWTAERLRPFLRPRSW